MAEIREGRFTLDIKRWTEKAKGNADKVVRAVAQELLGRVVMRTPVGNPYLWKRKPPAGYVGGRLRGSWVVSIGEPSRETPERIDKTGTLALDAGATVIAQARAGTSIYIMSNLPYAIPIEYGHSTQAPAGMVRVTVAEFEAVARDAVRSLR